MSTVLLMLAAVFITVGAGVLLVAGIVQAVQ